MAATDVGLNSIADQRYYHFVVLRDRERFSLATFWRGVGDVLEPIHSAAFSEQKCIVQHRKLRSAKSFARGAVAGTLSEKGQGRPPYLYDLFAAKVDLRDEVYFLLGFPFAGLALEIIEELITNQRLLKSVELIAVDVPKLVGIMEKGQAGRFAGLKTHIVGLQFVVTDDKSLTAVRLGGDDPLSAEVYVQFLRPKVENGVVRPEHCVLACEREWRESEESAEDRRTFRSRLRVDEYGNFRFYAHLGCTNIRLVPYAIGQLRTVGCLRKVPANPLLRIGREDLE